MTFGEPTGLELPEVEVPGSGRLLPTVGEMAGGVTEDMMMVGGFTVSRVIPDLFSSVPFVSTVKVDKVDIVIVFDSAVVTTDAFPLTVNDINAAVVVVIFVSMTEGLVGCVFASMLLDLSLFSVELR